ncbi:extracellular solute-binding protein [Candidatus Latescibacterota bacterium]
MKRRAFLRIVSGIFALISGIISCGKKKHEQIESVVKGMKNNEKKIILKGITWDHTRGYLPMVATSQRFHEWHPGVEFEWEKRSLKDFGDADIGHLARSYDLLVLDHPFAGYASKKGILIPIDEYLPEEYLQEQAENSVGKSYESYTFEGKQWALPIDAAAPVASYRPDLLLEKGESLPETWDDVLALARKGYVAFPCISTDTIMNFYMFCVSLNGGMFEDEEHVVPEDIGIKALRKMREIAALMTPEVFDWNPIKIYEAMTLRDDIVYCPCAFGYNNYSRSGYARKKLSFTGLVNIDDSMPLRSTLGGTGLAVSVLCRHRDLAFEYVKYVASPECQRKLYFNSGGQPGHRKAWLDNEVNNRTDDFFQNTLGTLDQAYLRPRYSGYIPFQEHAGIVIREYLIKGGSEKSVVSALNTQYRESLS